MFDFTPETIISLLHKISKLTVSKAFSRSIKTPPTKFPSSSDFFYMFSNANKGMVCRIIRAETKLSIIYQIVVI